MKPAYVIAAGAGIGLLIYLLGNAKGAGIAIGAGAVDLATGTVLGIGDGLGIPRTNVSKGQAELAAGDYWNASFDLPAGDFISGVYHRIFN